MARPYEVEVRGDDKSRRTFKQVKRNIEDIEKGLSRATRSGKRASDTFKGMTLSRVFVDGFYRVANLMERAVQAGFRYNQTMESARLGIGSIIASQMTLVSAEGKVLKGREALNAALEISNDLVKQIEIRGLQTTATTEQLVEAFQNAVGPATSMGLTLAQTRDITLDIVQAAGALGIPMHQLNEEVRSILGMTINQQSRVAKALHISNELVKTWAEQGVLAERLTETLATYRLAGVETAKTWAGLTSNMEEAIAKISGEVTRDIFEDLKKSMADFLKTLIVVNEEGVQLAPGIMEAKVIVNDLWAAFKEVGEAIKDFVSLEDAVSLMKSFANLTKSSAEGWHQLAESDIGKFVREGIHGIAVGYEHIAGLVREGWGPYLDRINGVQQEVTDSVNQTAEAVKAQATAYGKLGDDKIDTYRKAYVKAQQYLEKEHALFEKLEQNKIDLAQKRADLVQSLTRKELDYKRQIADYDKTEKQLERELRVLQGKAKPLTEEEQKKQRIADIEERLARLQESRKRAQEDYTKETARAKDELDELEKKGGELADKYEETKLNIQQVEQAIKDSSEGALTFNENITKAAVTANTLAQNLITAGKAISQYNQQIAKAPEALKKENTFDWTKLEAELKAPMQDTAEAASQTQDKIEKINKEIPIAVRELQNKRQEWERINAQAEEHLAKLDRIRYATQEWGFKIEGTPPHSGGEYGPGY